VAGRTGARLAVSLVIFCLGAELFGLAAYYVDTGALFYVHRKTYPELLPAPQDRLVVGEALHPPDEVEGAMRRLRHRRDKDDDAARRLERLTPRELEILAMMAAGKGPSEITKGLRMSPNTLRTHMQNVLTKLGVHSKMEALVLAIRHGKVATVDVNDEED